MTSIHLSEVGESLAVGNQLLSGVALVNELLVDVTDAVHSGVSAQPDRMRAVNHPEPTSGAKSTPGNLLSINLKAVD